MKTQTYYQQGDVLLKKISKLPEGLKPLKTKILQESEITGHHHHFLPDADVRVFTKAQTSIEDGIQTITPNEGKYIEVGTNGVVYLYHGKGFEEQPAITGRGDHDAIQIPPGTYEIDIVREYDYDTQEMVRVID